MATHFSVGQLVEVDATGLRPEAGLQPGDRGTMVRKAFRNQLGIMEATILWHKNQTESAVPEDRLRVYLNPMDAPGHAKGSFGTMTALRVVLQEEQPHAIKEITRDLERARMTTEDLRNRLCEHKRRAPHDEGSESEQMSDDEMGDAEPEVFCEACDEYYRRGIVAWFAEPFPYNGRRLYSACATCRQNIGLQDRPVLHW